MHLVRRSCALLSTAALTTALLAAAPPAATAAAPATPPDRGRRTSPASRRRRRCSTGSASPSAPCTPTPRRRSRSAFRCSGSPHWRCTEPSRRRWAASEAPPSAPPSSRPATGCCSTTTRPCAASSAPTGPRAWRSVRPGPVQAARRQVREAGARGVLRERAGDHYLDSTIHYSMPPGDGVWQPTPRRRTCSAPGSARCDTWWSGSTSRSTARTRSPAAPTPPSTTR